MEVENYKTVEESGSLKAEIQQKQNYILKQAFLSF